tara:strand:- start:7806 stop:8774 length:969 start_codon:yes stop_codon:yes gene_type:complete
MDNVYKIYFFGLIFFNFIHHNKITIFAIMKIELHQIFNSLYKDTNIKVFIKRLDLIESDISGNKYFKLKYNIKEVISKGYNKIVTFGGAFSNHILASSIIAKNNNLLSIGIIRGEAHHPLNATLKKATLNGMKLIYISRSEYKLKESKKFTENIYDLYGDCYIIPEGGTNDLAIKGTGDIITDHDDYDYICCPVGTGGTIAGIINTSNSNQRVLGFPAIKGFDTLNDNINLWSNKDNWTLIDKYNFGGYARFNNDLIDFIKDFYLNHNIPLDLIYTSKMIYGVNDLIRNNRINSNSSVLLIHTGGLQGNIGMNDRYNLNLPI